MTEPRRPAAAQNLEDVQLPGSVNGAVITEDAPFIPEDTAPNPKRQKRVPTPKAGNTRLTTEDIPYQSGVISSGLSRIYGFIGIGVSMFDRQWGESFLTVAEPAAQAWERLAKENASVRRVLHGILKTSTAGEVFAAHLPLILTAPGIRDKAGKMMAGFAPESAAAEGA